MEFLRVKLRQKSWTWDEQVQIPKIGRDFAQGLPMQDNHARLLTSLFRFKIVHYSIIFRSFLDSLMRVNSFQQEENIVFLALAVIACFTFIP